MKLIAIVSLLLCSMGWRGDHTTNRLKRKLATEPAKQQLQTEVEFRLRKAGIRVYTHEELLRAQGQPYLYVNVGVVLHADGWVSYGITVEFRQRASLDLNALSTPVTTWSTGGFGKAGILHLATLRDTVCDFVDQFINAYRSVSPRPASRPSENEAGIGGKAGLSWTIK